MRQERIRALLPLLNSKATGYRNGWVLAHCPRVWRHGGKDAHPSFAIKDTGKKKSICKCMSCGFGGDLMDLLFEVSGYLKNTPLPGYNLAQASSIITSEFEELDLNPSDIPDYDSPIDKTEVIFPESWLTTFKPYHLFDDAREYLSGRNVSNKMADHLDIRYDPMQRRVCFPYRSFKGSLMGLQGRSIDKANELRYYQYGYQSKRNSLNWMGEDSVNLDEPVILLEGPFDYASVVRAYPNVLASFTSGLSKAKVSRISDATEIVTFYDHGHGGDAARESISKYLKGYPITHVIPTKHQGDAGNMTLKEVASALSEHVKTI